jgi:hypothetical protein
MLFVEFMEVIKKKKYSYPRHRRWRPIGLWDVEDPTLSRQSALRASNALLPRNIFFCFWYSFQLEAE